MQHETMKSALFKLIL